MFGHIGPPPQNDQLVVLIARSNFTVSVVVFAASASTLKRAGESSTTCGACAWSAAAGTKATARTMRRVRMGDLRDAIVASAVATAASAARLRPNAVAAP